MKKLILPLLLSVFFHAAFAQDDEEGVPKKIKYKGLQSGRVGTAVDPAPLQGSVYGLAVRTDKVLQGKVSGLNIAAPDASEESPSVIIRCGARRRTSPLLFVDNILVPMGMLNTINPNDIASIKIINKEKATPIWGSEGKKGAVMVTTKFKALRLQVLDSLFKHPLSYAFVELDFYERGKANERLVADDSGYCFIPVSMLKDIASVNIIYAGYHARSLQPFSLYNENGTKIFLQKKDELDGVVVVCTTKTMEKDLYGGCNCFGMKTCSSAQDYEKALQGKFGCYGLVHDTVPGKIISSIQPKPFVFKEEDRLIVVDGVPVPAGKKFIPGPGNVASVDILKAESIRANTNIFSCGPVRDVVLITTKPGQIHTLITDRVSDQPVPNASVRLVFKQKSKQDKVLVADSAGYFVVEDRLLDRVSAMYISSVGYHEKVLAKDDIINAAGNIQLERKKQAADTAIAYATGYGRRISCGGICITRIRGKKLYAVKKKETVPVNIFPNPVKKGNALNIVFNTNNDERVNLSLISATGQQVYQTIRTVNEETVQAFIPVPANIAAGIYMLAAKNEQGKLVLNKRVVVE